MKQFTDLPKLMVVTDKPLHDKRLIEIKTLFNSFIIRSLKKEVTSKSTEELLMSLKKVIADNVDILNTEEAKETIEKMAHTIDILTKVDATFHIEVTEKEDEGIQKLSDGAMDICSLRGFPEYDIKIFAQWSKITAPSGFDEWFEDAVKPMVEIIKSDYVANDIRQEDTSTWDEQLWLYHTGFLMLCDLSDEDLRLWAESIWKAWFDYGEERFSYIWYLSQLTLWGIAEKPDKDYVISRTSHDAISFKKQAKETEAICRRRGLDLSFLN